MNLRRHNKLGAHMLKFPLFGLYCLAAWEVFLFQPLLSINLLLFGAAVFGLRRERAAVKAVEEEAYGYEARAVSVHGQASR